MSKPETYGEKSNREIIRRVTSPLLLSFPRDRAQPLALSKQEPRVDSADLKTYRRRRWLAEPSLAAVASAFR